MSRAKPTNELTINLILLIALVFRVAWMLYSKPVPVSDFEGYRGLAEGLMVHHQLGYPQPTAYRLPGYPFLLAIFMTVNRSVPWLSLVNIFLSTALIYMVYAIAWRLTGNVKVAQAAALVCALNPSFIFFAPLLASEHLFVLLVFSGLFVLMSPKIGSAWRAALSGLLIGLGILTRGEALFYLPVYLGASVFYMTGNPKKYWQPLILISTCFLTVIPWYLRNQYTVGPGAGLSTSAGLMIYYAHHDQQTDWDTLQEENLQGLNEIESSQRGYQLAYEYFRDFDLSRIATDVVISSLKLYAPNGYAVLWSIRIPRSSPTGPYPEKILPGRSLFILLTVIGYIFIALLALASLIFYKKYPQKMWGILLGIIAMNWVCYAIFFTSTPRYRYTAEVVFCILAGVTMVEITQRKRGVSDAWA